MPVEHVHVKARQRLCDLTSAMARNAEQPRHRRPRLACCGLPPSTDISPAAAMAVAVPTSASVRGWGGAGMGVEAGRGCHMNKNTSWFCILTHTPLQVYMILSEQIHQASAFGPPVCPAWHPPWAPEMQACSWQKKKHTRMDSGTNHPAGAGFVL